jgi:RNA polymerase sigma factor (sigma-70 family)
VDAYLKEWFVREILVHEPALTRSLARACPNPVDALDLRHDIYIKIIEAAQKSRPLSPKSFLFATARNLLVDRARRGRIVSIDFTQDLDALNVLIDEVSPERSLGARQQLGQVAEAFDGLSDRCRDVMWMKKIEGRSQKDIARQLKITEATVEFHLVSGMKQLTRLIFGGAAGGGSSMSSHRDEEVDHGK